jgi:acyl-coenzyme A thioesterase PaaI-like protein
MAESFQDLMTRNLCFGCGAGNTAGLQLRSYWDGQDAVCTFVPGSHHMAGPDHILNGGILSTIIDCHSVCTAVAHAHRLEERPIGSEPFIWYVTGSLKVDFLRPTPISQPVQLRAQIIEARERKTRVACLAASGGKECAVGDVLAVRVKESWLKEI